MKGAKIKVESYRPFSPASVVSKFARRLKGSLWLSPSSWFYERAFLPTEITRHFPEKSPEPGSCASHLEFCF